jgi:uncharacterized membrane protein
VVAAALHIAWLWYMPRFVTGRVVARIFDTYPTATSNRLLHTGPRYAGRDPVVRDNPDTVTSFAAYDVSALPLRVHCTVPDTDNYWSLSLYAWNTDNYFVVNDISAPAREFDLVIVKHGSLYEPVRGERVIESPSARGVAIVRMVVSDRRDTEELATAADIQRQTYCYPVEGVVY